MGSSANTETEGYFCRTQPFMPPRLFRNIGFDAIIIIASIGSMIYYSLTVLWPQIISAAVRDRLHPGRPAEPVVGGGILLGQVFGGLAITYVPKVKIQTIVVACMAMAFITPLVTIGPDTWAMTIALGTLACWGEKKPSHPFPFLSGCVPRLWSAC